MKDMLGKELKVGQYVRVHQDEGICEAVIVEIMEDRPTKNSKGCWVDIRKYDDKGVYALTEGMPSYILEVIKESVWSDTESTEPKPCPFCGSDALAFTHAENGITWDVHCVNKECYLSFGADWYFDTEEQAIAKWNNRLI